MFDLKGFPWIRPILLRLSLLIGYIDYSSSGVVKVTEHDDRFDIFLMDHFPELWYSLWGWCLSKDCKVLAVESGFHMAGIAVEVV